jgi:NAD(P)-dependent dehydrogenase (short-subunit alcohol dehydrogenase family)
MCVNAPLERPTALVIGVGADRTLGAACCRRFAAEGFHVIAVARTPIGAGRVINALINEGCSAEVHGLDNTDEGAVRKLFDHTFATGPGRSAPSVVVFHAGSSKRTAFLDLAASDFAKMWRTVCYAGFLIGREAVRHMAPLGRGTIIFSGATGSLRGKDGYAHYAAAKAGLRMVAQSLAREFGPKGIHVAHIILDAAIEGQTFTDAQRKHIEASDGTNILNVDAVAETLWHLHNQHRSAWTLELDLRPSVEPF